MLVSGSVHPKGQPHTDRFDGIRTLAPHFRVTFYATTGVVIGWLVEVVWLGLVAKDFCWLVGVWLELVGWLVGWLFGCLGFGCLDFFGGESWQSF